MPKPCMLKNMLPSTVAFIGATTMIVGSISLVPADRHLLAHGANYNTLLASSETKKTYGTVLETQAITEELPETVEKDYGFQQYIVSDQVSNVSEQLLPNIAGLSPQNSAVEEESINSYSETSEETTDTMLTQQETNISEEQKNDYATPLSMNDTPLFPVTDEQRTLIEMASQMKDTTPFSPDMGPNTNNRYDEWIKTDRSIKNVNSVRAYAFLQMGKYEWTVDEWVALDRLWWHESGWAPTRKDGDTSRAWGIPQALPASKMAKYGDDYLTNPFTQVLWGLDYINSRYGSPTKAWNFWLSQAQNGNPGWY